MDMHAFASFSLNAIPSPLFRNFVSCRLLYEPLCRWSWHLLFRSIALQFNVFSSLCIHFGCLFPFIKRCKKNNRPLRKAIATFFFYLVFFLWWCGFVNDVNATLLEQPKFIFFVFFALLLSCCFVSKIRRNKVEMNVRWCASCIFFKHLWNEFWNSERIDFSSFSSAHTAWL